MESDAQRKELQELQELLQTLDRTQQRIREIVGEGVDAITLPSGGAQLLPTAQDELQREEALQRHFAAQRAAVLDALPSNIAMIDQHGTIIAVNEAWRRFGRDNGSPDPDDWVGSNYLQVCELAADEDPTQPFADGIRSVLHGVNDEFNAEYPCHSPTEARWFRLQVVPVDLGKERGAALLHIDISSQYEAEAAKERTLRLFVVASQVARIGGWRLDVARNELEWSDQVFAIYGLPPGQAPRGDAALAMVAPEWRQLARKRMRACIEAGEDFDEEHEIITADGRRLWIRSTGEAVRNASGTVTHVQGASQDISRERSAESALAQSEGRFQRMATALPLLIWTADPDGKLDYANRAFFQFIGQPEGEISSALWELTIAEPDRDRAWAAWRRAVEHGSAYSIEYRFPTTSGEQRWLHMRAAPAHDEAGRVLKWYGSGIEITDRVLAENQALRLANRLEVTLNSINDSFLALDADWRYTYVNDRAAAFFQRPIDAFLGNEIWEVLPSLLGSTLEQRMREVMASRVAAEFEYPSALFNGVLEVSVFPAEDGGLAIYFRDITERVEARERLQREEARFRAVTQTTADVVYDWDIVSGRIWWSRGLASVFGYDEGESEADEALWIERLHPDDRERVVASKRTMVAAREPVWENHYRLRHAHGHYREVDDHGMMIFAADGAPQRLVGGVMDVTESRRAAAKLAQQAALLDQARDAIVVCDSSGRIQFWNRSAERIYGWERASVLNRSLAELLYEDQQAYRQVVKEVRARGQWRGRMQQRRADGSLLTVEGHWSRVDGDAMGGEDGAPGAVMAINTDITEQLLLEEQLHQAQRLEAVGQLTGGIAHDFNNLLTIVLGNSDLLFDELPHDEELREMAGMIKIAAERAAELTQRLLAFARKQPLDPRKVDVNRLLLGMDQMLRRTLGEQVEIEMVAGAGLWTALVDQGQLENAVLNLCINARDAMPGGGWLTLETSNAFLDETYASQYLEVVSGQYVRVSISDTGTGMSPETVQKAFDPFFTTKAVGGGSGLGLSMVYGFIKQSRGHVRIYSEIGEGTVIHLYLPRGVGRSDEDDRATRDGMEAPRGRGERILFVEDDDLVREHLVSQLRGLGYEVISARNGPEGLEALRQTAHLDLLFTDVVMPGGMSGRDLAEAARLLHPDLPVLFTSGYNENAIVHHGRLDVGVQLLIKPYRQKDLANKLRKVLEMGQSSGEG